MSKEDVSKLIPVSTYTLILETVKKYNEKFGQTLLVWVLMGSNEKRISQWNLDLYEHYGALGEYSKQTVMSLFDALEMENFTFKTDGKYPCVWITELGGAAIYRNHYITEYIEDLNGFVMRKVWNNFWNTSKSWGKSSSGSWLKKWQTYDETLKLFEQNMSLWEISQQRELWVQTIESHIVSLYESWKIPLMKILSIVDVDTAKKVKSVASDDYEWLKDIKESLEEKGEKNISYFQIKLTLAMMKKWDL